MVNRERVRKSSCWIGGVAKAETVCAADLIARNEAVRFDLNVDPRRGNDRDVLGFRELVSEHVESWLTTFSWDSGNSGSRRGWSNAQFSEHEGLRLRFPGGLLWLEGVGTVALNDESKSCSNEGLDSVDTEWFETDGVSLSSSFSKADFSISSGGLRRISSGELPGPPINSSSLNLTPSIRSLLKSSTWLPWGNLRESRALRFRRGIGIAVASRTEATELGRGRLVWEVDGVRRSGFRFLLVFCPSSVNSWCTDVTRGPGLGGITTGLVMLPPGRQRPESCNGPPLPFSSPLVVFSGDVEPNGRTLGTMMFISNRTPA